MARTIPLIYHLLIWLCNIYIYTTYIPLIVLANWVIIYHRSHLLREQETAKKTILFGFQDRSLSLRILEFLDIDPWFEKPMTDPWDEFGIFTYMNGWFILGKHMVNVGKYTSPMDSTGKKHRKISTARMWHHFFWVGMILCGEMSIVWSICREHFPHLLTTKIYDTYLF